MGSEASEFRNETSGRLDVITQATEILYNLTYGRDANDASFSENLKLLPSLSNSSSAHGDLTTYSNASHYVPSIPDYIRTTSIIFCVVILCLGLIGNIMVNSRK